jgi:prefoldin subunit 5
MALVAHVTAANGGRIVEKLLNKSAGKVALPKGARIEIIDTETGAPVHARSAQTTGEGLLLKFVTAEGEVALELSGDISAFAAMPLDGQAATDAAAPADGEAAAPQAGATTEAASTDDGEDRGMSPVLLGILGLGVLGGIAAAASGGGDKEAPKDTVAPNAPAGLDLASADDTGASTSDNITRNTSGLTIAGTAEANSKVELFNGATSLGTATADASGNFTLDVSLAAGTHSITAKATDAAGNVSVASTALSITVDTTAPTAAIAMSDAQLTSGETAVVTITFSEPVVDFTAADLTVGSGTLGPLVSSNNGLTWTATFTAAADVTDATNVIALGTGYSDVAGNAGTAASSPNYVVDAISFEVVQPDPDTVDFGGTATGPITITLNAQDEATFSRDGKTAVATIPGISTKVMNVPQGGVLNIVLDGEVTSDTFTLNAPNAAAMIFTGNGGNLSDTLNVIIESASADPDLRTLKVDTSGLTGVEAIRFAFPQDARDVVKLTADSKLTGFSTIEVSKGGVDLTSISVQPGVEFIVNSTLIVTLTQFEEMSSLISVTGLGQLVINLTADEVASGALEAFLSSADEKPILIGTTVTVMDPDGQPLDVPEALTAISYPGIPELSDRLDALEGQLADLAIGDVAGLAAALSSIGGAITALQASTGEEDAALSARIDELEGQLDGIAGTVVAYVDAQIAGLQSQIDGLGIEDVAELSTMLASIDEAISALQSSTGSETSALSERITALETKLAGIADTVVAYVDEQIAGLQTQIDGLAIDDIAELATTLGTISDAITALQGSTTSIETTIGHPADPDATPPVLATGLYLAIEGAVSALAEEVDAQIVDLQSQIDGLSIEDIAGLANSLSSINEAITALQGSAAGFEATIGHPADPDATPPVLATGLYLAIEGAVSALAEEIDTQIADLQSQIDDLSADDIAGLSTLLSSLNDTVSELSQLTGEGGAIDERLIALEGKLAGVTSTVIAYVDGRACGAADAARHCGYRSDRARHRPFLARNRRRDLRGERPAAIHRRRAACALQGCWRAVRGRWPHSHDRYSGR